jgi:hypothetical protein
VFGKEKKNNNNNNIKNNNINNNNISNNEIDGSFDKISLARGVEIKCERKKMMNLKNKY